MGIEAAALIRSARTAAGLTQAQLAKRLGTTQPEVARLESSRSNPRFQTLRRAVEATGHRLEAAVDRPDPGLDETLIVANLRVSPAERLRRFENDYRSIADLAQRARRTDGP